MTASFSRIIVATLGVAALCGEPLRAQCPDGTPPPCARPTAAPAARGPVDENLIAVFPFRISGSTGDAASLREGAMDLLALALDEQAGLRVVSSRTLLARARNFTDASPVSDAATIARSLGAGLMILGNGVVVGTQLRARAELHDVVRNRPVTSVEARGTSADPGPVIDSLAAALARVRLTSSDRHRSLQEFASTSPPALRAYLAAERLGRAGRWTDAADTLELAIRLDSTFGLAYYRLSVATRYAIMADPVVRDPIASALRFQGRLPRRQLELLRTVYATQRGDLHDALTQADATAAAYPDDPEAAFEQGEAYFHVGLALGGPTAPALRAFQRAIALDSAMLEPYNHASELLVLEGDTSTAVRLAERGRALAPDAEVQVASSLAMRILRGEDPAAAAREAHRLGFVGITRTSTEIQRIMTNDPARALATIERMLTVVGPDAPSNEQQSARLDRAVLLAARGQFAAAAASLPARGADAPLNQSTLRLTIQALSSHAASEGAGRSLPSEPGIVPHLAALAWNALLTNDSASWLDAAARLRRAPAPSDLYGAMLAGCLDGLAALRRGDSTRARAAMGPAAQVHSFSNNSELASHCVLQLARLELAAGARADAMQHLSVANYFNGIILERADMEELRAQIAVQQGDTAAAVGAFRNFIGLWQDADPELQPRVAAARAALAALEHR